jgi:hypothetical protein
MIPGRPPKMRAAATQDIPSRKRPSTRNKACPLLPKSTPPPAPGTEADWSGTALGRTTPANVWTGRTGQALGRPARGQSMTKLSQRTAQWPWRRMHSGMQMPASVAEPMPLAVNLQYSKLIVTLSGVLVPSTSASRPCRIDCHLERRWEVNVRLCKAQKGGTYSHGLLELALLQQLRKPGQRAQAAWMLSK